MSTTRRTYNKQNHKTSYRNTLSWGTTQHLLFSHISVLRRFPALMKQVYQKFKCSAKKHISSHMYIATLFWEKNVKIGKSYIAFYIWYLCKFLKYIQHNELYFVRVHKYSRAYKKHIRMIAYREEGIGNMNQKWKEKE